MSNGLPPAPAGYEYVNVPPASSPAPTNQDATMSQYTGMMSQGQDKELIEWILTPEDMISKFVNQFAGRIFNSNTGEWEDPDPTDRIMNEAGIRFWKSVLLGILNRNTIMTRYDNYDQIRRLAEPYVARVIITAELDKERLGMSSMHIDLMREALSNQIIPTLLRGLKGGERDFLNLTTKLQSTMEPSKKSGFWGGLLGMRK